MCRYFLCVYFLLRRWTRVFFSSLRCFFFAIRLRRFLITEPTSTPSLLELPRLPAASLPVAPAKPSPHQKVHFGGRRPKRRTASTTTATAARTTARGTWY